MSTLSKTLMVAAVVVPLLLAARQTNRIHVLEAENGRLRTAGETLAPPASRPEPALRGKESGKKEPLRGLGSAAREAIRERMEAAQRGLFPDSFEHSLFEKGGRGITPGAAKAAGLSHEETEAVSAILRKTWATVSEDFARRAILVEEESDEKNGHIVYMIPARPDRGREFNRQLVDELENAVGLSKLEILISGYQRTRSLGGFGAQDVRLEFLPDGKRFKFRYLSPLSGDWNRGGADTLEEFKDQFGDSFDIPEAAPPEP